MPAGAAALCGTQQVTSLLLPAGKGAALARQQQRQREKAAGCWCDASARHVLACNGIDDREATDSKSHNCAADALHPCVAIGGVACNTRTAVCGRGSTQQMPAVCLPALQVAGWPRGASRTTATPPLAAPPGRTCVELVAAPHAPQTRILLELIQQLQSRTGCTEPIRW